MTSVVDIIRDCGKWVRSKDLVVKEEFSISERQVRRRIKKAWKDERSIKRVSMGNAVFYGLPEWEPPENMTEETITYWEVLQQLKKQSKYGVFTHEISREDLAYMAGTTPDSIPEEAYRLFSKSGVRIGSKTITVDGSVAKP